MVTTARRLLLSLVVASSGLVTLKATEQARGEGLRLATNLILPLYKQSLAGVSDPIAEKHPHVLELRVQDVASVKGCQAWIVQMWVPTKIEPPYYGDNHHYEYWGILEGKRYFLGKGNYFRLDQEVEIDQLATFLADTCRPDPDARLVATTYLQVRLAGRFPFASLDSAVPRSWQWVMNAPQVPKKWLPEILQASAVPPSYESLPHGALFRGCVLARVGSDHDDIGCWSFRFDANTRLVEVEQTFRRQSVPGFSSDLHPRETPSGK